MTRYEVDDLIICAEALNDPFTDIHLITTKSKFVEEIYSKIPDKLIASGNEAAVMAVVREIIGAGKITVDEYVDLSTTPPTVCINKETIDENAMFEAANMIVTAIENSEDTNGHFVFTKNLKYDLFELGNVLVLN